MNEDISQKFHQHKSGLKKKKNTEECGFFPFEAIVKRKNKALDAESQGSSYSRLALPV